MKNNTVYDWLYMEGWQPFGQQALSLRGKAAIIESLREVMLVILYNCESCHIILLALILFMGVDIIMATVEAFFDLSSVKL